MTASHRTHTDAVIAALEAGGLTVGDSEPPSQDPVPPYVILYPISGFTDGGLVDPHEDVSFTWQATCVGSTREMAEGVVDRCNTLLAGVWLTVTGRMVGPVDPMLEAAGVRREDDGTRVFYATPRYRAVSRPT